jgi:CO/xanthine dehydrogenase FAD-binding subunit
VEGVLSGSPCLPMDPSQPYSDTRGTADYKRTVVRVFTERGLRTVREGMA